MSLNKNATYPIGEFDKDLIEKSLCWFENKLGDTFIKSRKYLVPQHCKFDYRYFDSQEAIQYFINFVCNYIEIDSSIIDYVILQDDDIIFSEGARTKQIDRGTALFLINEEEKYQITISARDLKDFDMTFMRMAYALTYIKFFSSGIFSFSNGYMINIGMVILGFGFICSNGAVRSSTWRGIAHSGWKVHRFGFINQRMYGYILALLFNYRSEKDRSLYNNLESDTLKYFKQSIDLIQEDQSDILFSIKTSSSEISDEDVFIRKLFYANGMLWIIEHYKNGKHEGVMTFYHQNGNLWGERIYKNGVSFTVLSNYDKDGDPVEKGTLKEGNGTLYIYDFDGSLLRIEEYRDSVRIDV
jgi:hypothetical protein